jgi:hypothetical protein
MIKIHGLQTGRHPSDWQTARRALLIRVICDLHPHVRFLRPHDNIECIEMKKQRKRHTLIERSRRYRRILTTKGFKNKRHKCNLMICARAQQYIGYHLERNSKCAQRDIVRCRYVRGSGESRGEGGAYAAFARRCGRRAGRGSELSQSEHCSLSQSQ